MAVNEGGYDEESAEFAYTELRPVQQALYPDDFSIFLVQVKSETESGRQLHNDPIDFFRRNVPELLGDEEDVRAMVLRVNAERSANPKHRSEVWISYPGGSKTAVGIQYKYDRDMLAQGD
jgi:hypothetical protein